MLLAGVTSKLERWATKEIVLAIQMDCTDAHLDWCGVHHYCCMLLPRECACAHAPTLTHIAYTEW